MQDRFKKLKDYKRYCDSLLTNIGFLQLPKGGHSLDPNISAWYEPSLENPSIVL